MHRAVQTLARFTALTGGFVLIALIVLASLSIVGRSINKALHNDFFQQTFAGGAQWLLDLGVGEINGNYEVLEAGVAFAIFSFLPICQFYGAHATVDIFTSMMSRGVNRWIAAFWEVVLAAAILLVIWRLYEGMLRYLGNGETTLFLQFPVWWAYAASFGAGVVACIVAVYCAAVRIIEALGNRDILPSEHGEH
ncbi:TRAP transporter small permease [Sulfitobacter sp. M57]|uniref:TRAP transporter small permease n=1 Tax=unclassified Sulfitobacter TaxID=196795 RepID=UPI0023E2125D|nr:MULTISPECIES: TRAP transporter small permease [unclassified Sulfitobacter]MDF3416264.1 TRAP transporter small permease [Sulfitobacter sp. KE5]MDF3423743.1 TRAP transporter small permease [Sulfitobacter sp. KE43]MDF3434810.1 TRAP transporter small permease [Sulfitobacter sp. KE42]MDF3460449.1 TRAP transporter small permease [Sulfitobacter sp. S74]MDF3464347.1 TRAP transporter small permease [Sulfitobacter sp. Ks18]